MDPPAPDDDASGSSGPRPPAPSAPGAEAQAFAEYVLPELDVLYRVAFSLTRNHADAEDVVQDTVLRAYRAIGRFDGRHPRAWLLTILRNTNRNRGRRVRPGLLADADAARNALESTEPARGDGGDAVVERTFDAVVESALRELSDKHRDVVELVDIDRLRA